MKPQHLALLGGVALFALEAAFMGLYTSTQFAAILLAVGFGNAARIWLFWQGGKMAAIAPDKARKARAFSALLTFAFCVYMWQVFKLGQLPAEILYLFVFLAVTMLLVEVVFSDSVAQEGTQGKYEKELEAWGDKLAKELEAEKETSARYWEHAETVTRKYLSLKESPAMPEGGRMTLNGKLYAPCTCTGSAKWHEMGNRANEATCPDCNQIIWKRTIKED